MRIVVSKHACSALVAAVLAVAGALTGAAQATVYLGFAVAAAHWRPLHISEWRWLF